jgi:N-acetylglucosamine-6-phosphate deacetylase
MPMLPGFVDLQVNGFLGVDFSSPDLTAESFALACRELLKRGTVAFLPTLITCPISVYRRNLPILAEVMEREEFRGRLLGLHLEGPFISTQAGAVGAHDPRYVIPPDLKLLQDLIAWANDQVRLITLAPELPGADQLARYAVGKGITVSLGHTLATAHDMGRLVQAGATALTHLGNGVPNTLPRHDNPIWAGLAQDALSAMLIADGHHLPAPVLKVMLRAKGTNRCIIVSDASPVAGMPPGEYVTLGNRAVLEPSGLLHNPEKGCLVGSSATLLDCMNHLARQRWLSFEDMVAVGLRNPLRLIGLDESAVSVASTVRFDPAAAVFSVEIPEALR